MKGKSKFFDALRQAKDAVEQANKALEDVMEEIGMDDLIRVAKNLEIRETGRVLTCDDFENHFCFFDGGVG